MEEQTINNLVAIGFIVLIMWGLHNVLNSDGNKRQY